MRRCLGARILHPAQCHALCQRRSGTKVAQSRYRDSSEDTINDATKHTTKDTIKDATKDNTKDTTKDTTKNTTRDAAKGPLIG